MKKICAPQYLAIGALLCNLMLTACSTPPKTLYQWEGYQTQLNSYFKGESPEAQLEALEAGLEKIKAKNGAVPPGYHAQLGLLYSSIGKDDQMVREFETEKALFPESSTYMNLLLNNSKEGSK